jgi:curved DNA-binding protein CbpA
MTLIEAATIFGLSTLVGVTPEQLKKTYHELAGKYHPDKGGTVDEFIALRSAYTALQTALRQNKSIDEDTEAASSDTTERHYSESETQHTNEPNNYEELMKKYQSLQREYEELYSIHKRYDEAFNIEIRVINDTVTRINTLSSEYEHNYEHNHTTLQQILQELSDRQYRTWWQYLIPIPKLSREEYIKRHNQYIAEYDEQITSLNNNYTQAITERYKYAFSRFVNLIKEL